MKKKLIFGCAVAVLLSAASCNGGSSANPKDLKTANDSLSYYFGEMWGSGYGSELKRSPDSARVNKQSFIKGLETALSADTSDVGYIQGLAVGSQLSQTFAQLKKQEKIDIDTKLVIAAFKKAFTADSMGDPSTAQAIVMGLVQRISAENKAKSPEALANKNAGTAATEKVMKADPAFKKTASGLVYKAEKEGTGETFKASDRIMVKYTGKHIDGKVFDQSGEEARPFSPLGVVPGFKEGLLMMKPGAKYILYIPGELAYGIEGQPMAGIGPNETLIFEVETISLAPETPAK
jgi:peptidyl-prolyl cis-trans isomerase